MLETGPGSAEPTSYSPKHKLAESRVLVGGVRHRGKSGERHTDDLELGASRWERCRVREEDRAHLLQNVPRTL